MGTQYNRQEKANKIIRGRHRMDTLLGWAAHKLLNRFRPDECANYIRHCGVAQ